MDGHAGDTTLTGDQVERQRVLDDGDRRRLQHRGNESALDLRTGGVPAGVDDAVTVVAALTRQLQLTQRVGVEHRPEVDQLAKRCRAFCDQRADSVLVAQTCTGDERVVEVLLRTVSGADRCRYPTHRPTGGAG